MKYLLEPKEVKKIIDAKINGMPIDENQFLYYHLYRNYFNVKNEIKTLKLIGDKKYRDNLGNIWEEQPVFKNFFHMPKTNWIASIAGISVPYSRKFLRDDNISGIGGEFEMVIRYDGKRIDAFTQVDYQETYNFGRTRMTIIHKILDIDTHNKNGNYTFKMDMGKVIITN